MPGKDTILIVDDEQLVLDVGCAILKQIGYRAVSAKDGNTAIEILESRRYDLYGVILDLAMPGMDGRACLKAMRRIDPDLKVILASGYKEEQAAAMFSEERPDAFVQKPFVVAILAQKIESLQG